MVVGSGLALDLFGGGGGGGELAVVLDRVFFPRPLPLPEEVVLLLSISDSSSGRSDVL